MLILEHAVFMYATGRSPAQPIGAVIYGWGRYQDKVSVSRARTGQNRRG
jgi:hypothetical protein